MLKMITLLLPILIPILAGLVLLVIPGFTDRKKINRYTAIFLIITAVLIINALRSEEEIIHLFNLNLYLPIVLKLDSLGRIFAAMVSIIWLCCGFYAFEYMKHEENPKRYFGFYLMTYGVLIGLDFAGNLITMYMFYELMTLASFALVIHNQSREAIMAGLKYLFYSFFGAYMALFGIYFIVKYANTLTFTAGGVINADILMEKNGLFLVILMMMLLGFGVKAGMFPLHAWLPSAHPVAPAPASAALSAMIVKSGVLALIRVVYYIFGADFLKGTWVQTVWISLSLLTVFMGSMLAYRERNLKKRMAYSTVSQISYIIFGLSMLNETSLTGSMLHVIAHACIKCTLFLCAGVIIYKTGCTKVDELRGIGKRMPVTMGCYTIVSLALIGIPPTSGFVSKWYLAVGSLSTGMKVFAYLGVIVLLISALLTAGYLLPVSIEGFFPGDDFLAKEKYEGKEKCGPKEHGEMKEMSEVKENCEPNLYMLIPLIVLTVITVLLGMFPDTLIQFIADFVSALC